MDAPPILGGSYKGEVSYPMIGRPEINNPEINRPEISDLKIKRFENKYSGAKSRTLVLKKDMFAKNAPR